MRTRSIQGMEEGMLEGTNNKEGRGQNTEHGRLEDYRCYIYFWKNGCINANDEPVSLGAMD